MMRVEETGLGFAKPDSFNPYKLRFLFQLLVEKSKKKVVLEKKKKNNESMSNPPAQKGCGFVRECQIKLRRRN